MTRDEALETIQKLENRLGAMDERFAHVAKRVTQLEEENAQLRERVAELESEVTPDPTAKPYQQKTREEKVKEVRIALARKAVEQGGKAWFDYNDVKALFGSRPSNGHAYDLMEIAAELDGFEYGTFHGEKRLRVNLEAVNDDAVLHAANNDDPAEVS